MVNDAMRQTNSTSKSSIPVGPLMSLESSSSIFSKLFFLSKRSKFAMDDLERVALQIGLSEVEDPVGSVCEACDNVLGSLRPFRAYKSIFNKDVKLEQTVYPSGIH